MDLPRHKRIAYFSLTAAFLLLWLFYGLYHRGVAISSDSTSMLPVAFDLAHGNLLLKGWTVGTNNFIFTETIFYALGMLLHLGNETLMNAIPALFYALFIVTMIYAFVLKDDRYKDLGWKNNTLISIAYAVIVGIVATRAAYTLLNANSHNNLYFWMILCWLMIIRYYDTRKITYLVGYVILAALLAYSESVIYMVLFAPVGVYCLYEMWQGPKEGRKGQLLVIGSTALGFLLAKIIGIVIEKSGGIVTRGLPIHLVPVREMLHRIVEYIPHINILYGFDGFRSAGFAGIALIYNLFILIIMIGCLLAIVYNTIRFKSCSRMDKVLYLITVINIAACICTDTAVFYRYIVPAYSFGTLLLIKTVFRLCAEKREGTGKRFTVCVVAAVVVLATISGYRSVQIMRLEPFGVMEKNVMQTIEDKCYGAGYGDFWCSSMVSYYSDFNVPIYPVYAEGTPIVRYWELVKGEWYAEKDKHFIITYADGSSKFINNDNLFALLGKPDDSFVCGNYEVLYWTKDISDYVSATE